MYGLKYYSILADNVWELCVAFLKYRGNATLARLLVERDRDAAILHISTELEEAMAMSDRIAVIYRGEFIAILDAQTATIEKLVY